MLRLVFLWLLCVGGVSAREVVVLLHGLCRSASSMEKMEAALKKEGYDVINIDYSSRHAPIERMAEATLGDAVRSKRLRSAGKVHFVTHSLGGILVRSYLSKHRLPNLGRVVMLGPPNHGSEVVDRLKGWRLFKAINGPAGSELGTHPSSVPNRLPPVAFELGVIAGDRTINLINSCMIPGVDDGKVSVESTKVSGMKDHLVIHACHPLLMKNREAMGQVSHFLRAGRFRKPPASVR